MNEQTQAQLRENEGLQREAEFLQRTQNDLDHNLPEIYANLLTVLTEIADIMNTRDNIKFKLDLADGLASSTLFIMMIVHSILAVVNAEDEVKDGYPNVENAASWMGIYYAEFVFTGILNGLFATNKDDWNDRALKFYHLPKTLQDKITVLYTQLNPLGLKTEIDPNCDVTVLIKTIFDTLKTANARIREIQRQFPAQVLTLTNLKMPDLCKHDWRRSLDEKIKIFCLLYCTLLVLQAVISARSYRDNPTTDAYKQLGYGYVLSMTTFPTYTVGLVIGEFSRYLTVACSQKICALSTAAFSRITHAFDQTRGIEMQPLNDTNLDRNQDEALETGLLRSAVQNN